MKRKVLKLLSVVLALALILSMVPMISMAEEVHEHEVVCNCSEAAPAAIICTHTYYMATSYNHVSQGSSGHLTTVYNIYTCSKCGVSYSEVESSYTASHVWTPNPDGLYVYCSYCGYIR